LRALFRRQSANLHDREDLAAYSMLYLHEMKILGDHACQRQRSNRANPYKGDMCLPDGNAASSSASAESAIRRGQVMLSRDAR
jgi:hypothetical protein